MSDYWDQFEQINKSPEVKQEMAPVKEGDHDYWSKFETVEQKPEGILSKLAEGAEKYVIKPVETLRLPEIAGGLLQSGVSAGRSLAGIPIGLVNMLTGSKLQRPEVDLQESLRKDPMSKAAFLSGEIGGFAVPFTQLQKGLEGLIGATSLPRMMASGAGTGYALGDVGGEDRNLTGTGRIIGASLGGLPAALGAARDTSLAKRILEKGKDLKANYGNKYEDLFKRIGDTESGSNLRVPVELQKGVKNLKDLKTGGTSEYLKSLEKFSENPTFENAHYAQSDMGKMQRYLENVFGKAKEEIKGTPSQKRRAYKAADMLQKKLRGSMYEALVKGNNPQHMQEYVNLTKGYAKDVSPYLRGAIKELQGKKISSSKAKKLIDSLMETGAFEEGIEAPAGLGLRNLMKKPVIKDISGKAIGTGAGIGLGMVGAPWFIKKLAE